MRNIIINAPDGQYYLPVDVVAHDRAIYYSQGSDDTYHEEYVYTLSDDYEIIDWLLNNMDWEDVSDQAVKFTEKILISEDGFWTNSDDFEIQ